jgi:hypothetical protein
MVFMGSLFEPGELQRRIAIWCEEETRTSRLPKEIWPLLREALLCGEFAYGKAPELTAYQERQAPTVLNTLIENGFLVSPTSRSPVRLGFPLAVVDRWFPRPYVEPAISGSSSKDDSIKPPTTRAGYAIRPHAA